MRFTGRNVVVTGAGSGIGRATALMMCQEGARVLGVDKTFDRSSPADYGDKLTLLELDIAAPEAPDRVVRDIEELYGVPHVLVNAAGVLRIGPMMTVRREDWSDVITVNLTGAFFMIQAVAAVMIRGKVAGRIVKRVLGPCRCVRTQRGCVRSIEGRPGGHDTDRRHRAGTPWDLGQLCSTWCDMDWHEQADLHAGGGAGTGDKDPPFHHRSTRVDRISHLLSEF